MFNKLKKLIFGVPAPPQEQTPVEIQWKKWAAIDHNSNEQYARRGRALMETRPLWINTDLLVGLFQPTAVDKNAIIYTTTLEHCDCTDFQRREKPCKHIYRLRYELIQDSPLNPEITNVSDDLLKPITELSQYDQVQIFDTMLNWDSDRILIYMTPALNRAVKAGIFEKDPELSDEDYRGLLQPMTKDDMFLALAKNEVSGFKANWKKADLIGWILTEQPDFLRKYFRKYAWIRITERYQDWAHGIRMSELGYEKKTNWEDLKKPDFNPYG